jgi:flavin reductase (DIM6/NTAB) family NADH-FMN oxidoreductase RutF
MLLDDLVLSNRPAPTPVKPDQFRTVLSHFASGVVVITGRDGHHIAVGRVLTLAAVGPEPAPLIFFRSHYWVAGPHPGDA